VIDFWTLVISLSGSVGVWYFGLVATSNLGNSWGHLVLGLARVKPASNKVLVNNQAVVFSRASVTAMADQLARIIPRFQETLQPTM